MVYQDSLNIHFTNSKNTVQLTSEYDLKSTCELINSSSSSSEQERTSILRGHHVNNSSNSSHFLKLKGLFYRNTWNLFTILGFVLMIILIFILLYRSYNSNQPQIVSESVIKSKQMKNPSKTCTSVECYSASNFLIKHMNQSENPCHDFYEFACGEWTQNLDNKLETDQFTMAIDSFLVDFGSILEEPYMPLKDSKIVFNLKKFYSSCVNELDIETESDVGFYEYMRSDFGDWPMVPVDSSVSNKKFTNNLIRSNVFDQSSFVEVVLARLTVLHTPIVFRFAIDLSDDHRFLVRLSTPQDFCSLQNFLPNTQNEIEAFRILVKTILQKMKDSLSAPESLSDTDLNQQIDEMLILLNHIFLVDNPIYACGIQRNLTETHLLTINQIDKILNKDGYLFNMTLYVTEVNKASSIKVDLSRANFMVSGFILTRLKYTFTNLKTKYFSSIIFSQAFQNLVYFHSMFHILQPIELLDLPHYHLKMPVKYYQAFFEYETVLKKNKKLLIERLQKIFKLDNKKNCAYSTYTEFSTINSIDQLEMQYFFLTRKFDLSKKAYGLEMIKNLVGATLEILDKQSWINSETKKNVRLNIYKLQKQIAYSDIIDESIRDKNLNKKLTNGQLDFFNLTDHYIINLFMMRKRNYEKEFDLINTYQHHRMQNSSTMIDLFSVNMFYFEQYNSIILPGGILYEPIFNTKYPLYLNYATVGVYLSHELWHFIEKEIFKNMKDEEFASHSYIAHLHCLKENYQIYVNSKYGNIEIGFTSVEEQIADIFGIFTALYAYEKLANKSVEENELLDPLMPRLDYNQRQLFLIRHAQSYCRKRDLESMLFHSVHPIHDYRAFQTSLTGVFQKTFECGGIKNKYSINTCDVFEL